MSKARPHDPQRPTRRASGRLLALALATATVGCQAGTSPIARWRSVRDTSIAPPPTSDELPDDRNLFTRWLSPEGVSHSRDGRGLASASEIIGSRGIFPKQEAPDPEAAAEFRSAEQLFQKHQLPQAEKAFKALAKKREGSSWGEKALYFLGESQYQRGQYVAAHDTFETLIHDHPNSRYKEKIVAREYAIAQVWLAQSDPKTPGEKKLPWTAHFTGGLPLIDTGGHAEMVLEHVRHNDPGPEAPLADDASMKIADRHYDLKDYESAAFFYDQLIAEYPRSPLLQTAHLRSIDSKIKGYIGPDYDGSGLKQAASTARQALTIFPDRDPEVEQTLYQTLDLVADQEAERAFQMGEYFRRRDKVPSAEYYYSMVVHRWPKSPWAEEARTHLSSLAKAPRKETLPSKIMAVPGHQDPYSGSGAGLPQNSTGPSGMIGP